MKLPSKKCIVCGRPVQRSMQDITVQPFIHDGDYQRGAQIVATIFSKEDCKRYTNQPYVVSVIKDADGAIIRFTVWDGTSYFHGGHFCTGRCAQKQGYASSQHGARYVWERGE